MFEQRHRFIEHLKRFWSIIGGAEDIRIHKKVFLLALGSFLGGLLAISWAFFLLFGISTQSVVPEVVSVDSSSASSLVHPTSQISPKPKASVSSESLESDQITVDVGGAVVIPGSMRASGQSRLGDIIQQAGGLSSQADSYFVSKVLNLASPVVDGQKIYIPSKEDMDTYAACLELVKQSSLESKAISSDANNANDRRGISINTATQSELETLDGIGAKRAETIIEHRPYLSLDGLVEEGVLSQTMFEAISDQITL